MRSGVFSAIAIVALLSPVLGYAGFEPAKRTHAPELKPPAQLAGAGIEGWALVCVSVDSTGKTSDPRVVEVSPNDGFAEAGKNAAEGWKFRPAKQDGKAVEESDVCGIQLFTVGAPVSEKTTKKLDEATVLLDDDEVDEAKRVLKGLEEEGPLTPKQAARLQTLIYRIAAEEGDAPAAVRAIERASIGDGRFLDDETRMNALGAKFHGWVNERHYRDAIDLFQMFEGMDGGARPMVIHGKTAKEIRDLGTSETSFTVPAVLTPALASTGGSWRHRPLRREIGVRNVEGELEAFSIECDHRKMRLDYQQDVSWKIPDSWGVCTIYAEGDPGTTFELIEYGVAPD